MALSTTGLLETLCAASSLATQELKYSNSMLELIFKQLKSESGAFGQTLNIVVPNVEEGDVVDIQGGPLQPADESHNTYPILLNANESVSFVVKDWDKARTPKDLKDLYMKPKLEALLRKVNRRAANLVTAANFNKYATVVSTAVKADGVTANPLTFARQDLAAGWGILTDAGVPTEDGNLAFVSNPICYSNMMKDKDFYQENIVGVEAAVGLIQKAMFAPQFNMRIRHDQQIPRPGQTYAGFMFKSTAIGMVTCNYPRSEDPSVKETITFPKPNIPVRVQAQYSLRDQGTLINMHCIFGMAVIRPEHGLYMVTQ